MLQCTSIEKLYKLRQRLRKYAIEKQKQHLVFTKQFNTRIKMDSQNMSNNAGQAKGQAQVYVFNFLCQVETAQNHSGSELSNNHFMQEKLLDNLNRQCLN